MRQGVIMEGLIHGLNRTSKTLTLKAAYMMDTVGTRSEGGYYDKSGGAKYGIECADSHPGFGAAGISDDFFAAIGPMHDFKVC
jgi:hypothetical protein